MIPRFRPYRLGLCALALCMILFVRQLAVRERPKKHDDELLVQGDCPMCKELGIKHLTELVMNDSQAGEPDQGEGDENRESLYKPHRLPDAMLFDTRDDLPTNENEADIRRQALQSYNLKVGNESTNLTINDDGFLGEIGHLQEENEQPLIEMKFVMEKQDKPLDKIPLLDNGKHIPRDTNPKSEQDMPVGGDKPVDEDKSIGQEKTMVQEKSVGQEKSLGQEKPMGQEKPIGREKPMGQENPIGQEKPIGEEKPIGQSEERGKRAAPAVAQAKEEPAKDKVESQGKEGAQNKLASQDKLAAQGDPGSQTKRASQGEVVPEKRPKLVLVWNMDVHLNEIEQGCKPYACLWTVNRELFNSADAVLIKIPVDADPLVLTYDLPKTRPVNQVWIFYTREPPTNSLYDLKPLDGLFNATFTYREDSDIQWPFGVFKAFPEEVVHYNRMRPAINYARGKAKLVAWMVSNCDDNSHSLRMEYARELMKYIPVDIYGSCGTLKCEKRFTNECYKMIGETYKFYLSFESAICRDYLTEKFWQYRNAGAVPIVIGGYNYTNFPPKTVIDVTKFDSVKQLAEYLVMLDQDDSLYNQYFDWQSTHIIASGMGFCRLCRFLEENPGYQNTYKVSEWWKAETSCTRAEDYYRGSADILVNATWAQAKGGT